MSYEGYIQAACINGHYQQWDCTEEAQFKVCDQSGGRWAVRNDVDETNCEGWRFRQEIEEVLDNVRKQGADNCLKEVVAWLRNNPHWAKATHEWIAETLQSGQWKMKRPK